MVSHYHLVQLAGLANTVRGAEVAGSRGYFLTGMGVRLNQVRYHPTATAAATRPEGAMRYAKALGGRMAGPPTLCEPVRAASRSSCALSATAQREPRMSVGSALPSATSTGTYLVCTRLSVQAAVHVLADPFRHEQVSHGQGTPLALPHSPSV